jgi:hypothetical protein
MPVFPEQIVSEKDAARIHAYLRELSPDVPRLRADLPRGVHDPASCAECHRTLHATARRAPPVAERRSCS